ncbi:MAG: PilZ domain-containing protein [Deltaproteobacteria bacterium]|nr:PilZ domain-containing protein [Nannocystaceae bacterium]
MFDRAAIVSTLQTACAMRAGCGLLLPSEDVRLGGRFTGLAAGMLLLELGPDRDIDAIGPAQVVCVTFNHARGSCCFMSRVLSCSAVHGASDRNRARSERVPAIVSPAARVRLAMPDTMSGIDGRLAFRVPVLDRELELDLGDTAAGGRVSVIDICIGGAQIELPEQHVALQLRQRVQVTIRLRQSTFTTLAEVRRRTDRRYGLFFVDVLREGRVVPPTALARIVRELERRWLEQRRGMARR